MKETEITIQVFDDFLSIDKHLKELGYSVQEEYTMKDTYFTSLLNLENISYLQLLKNSFLVREILDDNPKIFITYKDKVLNENNEVISEEKTNLKIDNVEKAVKIFTKCNLNNWCNVNATITVYINEHIVFSVQQVENLGIFIEYEEDETMKDMTLDEKRNYMKNTLLDLGLNLGKDFSCKKVFMLYQKLKNEKVD